MAVDRGGYRFIRTPWPRRPWRGLAAIVAMAFLWTFTPITILASASSSPVEAVFVVNPATMDDWTFTTTSPRGLTTAVAQMVDGPSTPPFGTGSARFRIGPGGFGTSELRHDALTGVLLSSLTDLRYSTLVTSKLDNNIIYLAIDLDLNNDGAFDDRIVFEPKYQDGTFNPAIPAQPTVQLDTWQTWDAFGGGWWSRSCVASPFTCIAGASPGAGVKSLADYLAIEPDARILAPPVQMRPNGEIITGTWSPLPLWPSLDDHDDSDYISATAETFATLDTTNIPDPMTSAGHVVRFSARATGTGPTEGIGVEVFQPGIPNLADSGAIPITRGSFNTYTFVLSDAQANSITDYGALRLKISSYDLAPGEQVDFAWMELDTTLGGIRLLAGSGLGAGAWNGFSGYADAFTVSASEGATYDFELSDARVHLDAGSDGSLDLGLGTIQSAVNLAHDGDTIYVDEGAFSELVSVSKSVTLLGAQHGVDARSRSGDAATESVVGGPGGAFELLADGITIDGFTIRDVSGGPGAGISTSADRSGYEIVNNIIEDNVLGVYLNSDGAFPTIVHYNMIRNNNLPGSSSGNGIYSDAGAQDILIDSNVFTGHDSAAIVFAGTGQSDVQITNNEIVDDAGSILLLRLTDASIDGNTWTNSGGGSILLGGETENVVITDNEMRDGTRGIEVLVGAFGDSGQVQNVQARFNLIEGNSVAGLEVAAGAYTGTLDAECNWWGSATGPAAADNLGGLGNGVADPDGVIDFRPWLPSTDPLSCSGAVHLDIGSNGVIDVEFDGVQAAVDVASEGDTVLVGAGVYPELVVLSEPLVIRGAQAGVDARTRSGVPETVIGTADGAFQVLADDVVIDGFTVRGVSGGLGAGIFTSGGHSGYAILNNIIEDNVLGVYLNSDGTHATSVQHNLIRNNNLPGSSSGNGIYSDAGAQGILIDSNVFTGHDSAAIVFAGVGQSDVQITNNEIVDDAGSVRLFGLTDVSIVGNRWTDSGGSSIFLGGGVGGAFIANNEMLDGVRGIHAAVGLSGDLGTVTGVVARFNLIEGNTFAGLEVVAGAYSGTLDAECNWWGSATGPAASDNLGGLGNGVADPDGVVDFRPWLATESLVGCAGPVHLDLGSNGVVDVEFGSIQAAVDVAGDGDTVLIDAGFYPEVVAVSHSVRLVGAGQGIDARTRFGVPETVIGTADGAFEILADDVVIDGFTIRGVSGGLGAGIYTSGSHSGYEILNNIIEENVLGLYLNSDGTHPAIVRFNLFQNNNLPGFATGNGIYSDTGARGILIEENLFTGHDSSAITFAGAGQSDIQITNNEIVDDAGSVRLFGLSDVSIVGNRWTDSGGSSIFLGGGVDGALITNNEMLGGLRGIEVLSDGLDANADVMIRFNLIGGNTVAGLEVAEGAYTGTLDAECNWWGSATGPVASDNPFGIGDAVTDPDGVVDFRPWLSTDSLVGCAGPVHLDLGSNGVIDVEFGSIQPAVDISSAGDTILVDAGTYPVTVRVDRTLTLLGAQHGVDARTRSGVPETVIGTADGAFVILADGVVIDGFTIRGVSGGLGAGIYTSAEHSGYSILNNVITGNRMGVYLGSNGLSPTLVQFNLLQENNLAGATSGNGIYSDEGAHDVWIVENAFVGHESASIALVGGTGGTATSQSQIHVMENSIDRRILLFFTDDSEIEGNEILISPALGGSGIVLGGGVTDLDIIGNTIQGAPGAGVRAVLARGVTVPNADLLIQDNTFLGNRRGIALNHADRVLIRYNVISESSIGVRARFGTDIVVEGNVIESPVRHGDSPVIGGVEAVNVDGVAVLGNAIEFGGSVPRVPNLFGISLRDSSGEVSWNSVMEVRMASLDFGVETGIGIILTGTGEVDVEHNVITGYQLAGIVAGDPRDGFGNDHIYVEIERNVLTGNGPTGKIVQVGVLVADGTRGHVALNEIVDHAYRNGGHTAAGVRVNRAGFGFEVWGNELRNNQVGIDIIRSEDAWVGGNFVWIESGGLLSRCKGRDGDVHLFGIRYQNAWGQIVDNVVTGIRFEPEGRRCESGIGILLEGQSSALILRNEVRSYQKGGIAAGRVDAPLDGWAEILDNVVVGLGPTDKVAQFGIQVLGPDADGIVRGNQVSRNQFTGCPKKDAKAGLCTRYEGTGLLLFDVEPKEVKTSNNKLRENDRNHWVIPAASKDKDDNHGPAPPVF